MRNADSDDSRKGASKKRKRGDKDDNFKNLVDTERLALKRDFEEQRDETLNALPKQYRAKFGQIAFTKYQKKKPHTPLLVLNPYDVPPGSVRNDWLNMFNKMKSRGTISKLSYVVYWYGYADRENECYGYVAPGSLISWEKEVAEGSKGAHVRPSTLQTKVDNGDNLSSVEQLAVHTYNELEEDIPKDPADRKRGILDFPEGYAMMSEKEIVAAIKGIDTDDDLDLTPAKTDDDSSAEEAPKPAKRKLKLKISLKKKKKVESDDDDEEAENAVPKAKSGRKRKAKIEKETVKKTSKTSKPTKVVKKGKRKSVDDDVNAEMIAAIPKKATKGKKKVEVEKSDDDDSMKSVPKKAKKAKKKKGVVDSDGAESISSVPKKATKAKKKKEVVDSDDLESTSAVPKKVKKARKKNELIDSSDDETREHLPVAKKKTRKGRKSGFSSDNDVEPPPKKTTKAKRDTKIDEAKAKQSRSKKGEKKNARRSKNDAENESPDDSEDASCNISPIREDLELDQSFQHCKKLYLAIVEEWQNCIESHEWDSAPELFERLGDVASSFTLNFMKHYEVRSLVDRTETALKEGDIDSESFVTFKDTLLKTYAIKLVEKSNGVSPAVSSTRVDSDAIGDDEESGDDERDAEYAADGDDSSKDESEDVAKPVEKTKIAKKAQKAKHKIDRPLTLQQKKKRETLAFKQCEKDYLPLIEKWELAIQGADTAALETAFLTAGEIVKELSGTFIKIYLAPIMKETKATLKNGGKDLTKYNEVRQKIKTSFTEKISLVPENFAPKKSKAGVSIASRKAVEAIAKTDSLDESQRSIRSITARKSVEASSKTDSLDESQRSIRSISSAKSIENPARIPRVDRSGGQSMKGSTGENPSQPGSTRPSVPPKPERKKFSLGSLMRQPSVSGDSLSRETSAKDFPKSTTVVEKQAKRSLPSWVAGPAFIDEPKEDPRAFALEFLLQTASHFPKGSVDCDCLARTVEAAIYDWAASGTWGSEDKSWIPKYWTKIHAIVAAICGKRESGTLVDLILQGRFASPKLLLDLSDENLELSFESQPLLL